MMTCRLLCALLVLALCCCPSVCVTGTEGKAEEAGDQDTDSSSSSPAQQQEAGVSGPNETAPLSQPSTVQTQGENLTSQVSGPGPGVPGSPDTTSPQSILEQEQQPSGSVSAAAASSSVTAPVSAQSERENTPTTTTTTTTKAPTTTTTTTTEAPTTTTTRAPSLLRESDGSLSSSAWVCAPLLLAVSALAYTTLG
ncbi:putative mucin TcMUCII [Trypanosoma cruzi]|uniref:Mucin TcMUCII, putative n=3 Tax=Trypanosoma cruzi TaxID=5693 RepID=Q4DQ69_TRYCC|nr:mucin TcMUCII, putative [Trypanosoma cruzi]EAN94679.1 mucin TcMUCII, putative [Trypanosoma cruzi]PWV14720.1 putative mucin TcMUCII [Trypanosoma cruzi]|eukprot:XP_816530.1 mucin TcMUCII [Trypanosoma cruzi strain CL Brener]